MMRKKLRTLKLKLREELIAEGRVKRVENISGEVYNVFGFNSEQIKQLRMRDRRKYED